MMICSSCGSAQPLVYGNYTKWRDLVDEWKSGLRINSQQAIPVVCETVHILTGFHAGLVVEDAAIVKIKALESIAAGAQKELLRYLKLADKRLACSSTSMRPSTLWPRRSGLSAFH